MISLSVQIQSGSESTSVRRMQLSMKDGTDTMEI